MQEGQRESSADPPSQPDILRPVDVHRVRPRAADHHQPQQRRPPAACPLVQVPRD